MRGATLVFGYRAPLVIFTHNPVELKFGCWMHLSPHQCSNSKRPASRNVPVYTFVPSRGGPSLKAGPSILIIKRWARNETEFASASRFLSGSRASTAPGVAHARWKTFSIPVPSPYAVGRRLCLWLRCARHALPTLHASDDLTPPTMPVCTENSIRRRRSKGTA
jgi:hypothetical protein